MSLPVPSGVPGLDEIVGGGIPAGSCVLIEGVPGAGKTTLGVQIAVSRARAGQRCLIIALEELPGQILRDAANFGWDLTDLERKGLMTLVCTSPDLLFEQLESGGGPVGTLLGSHEVDTVVLDSLDHLYVYGTPRTSQRTAVYSLINALKRSGVTAILTKELHSADPDLVPFEEYLSDVALRLTYELDANRRRFRYVEVLKSRGLPNRSGKHSFQITSTGFVVYPRLQVEPESDKQAPQHPDVVSSGMAGLDQMLDGGLPRGSATLVAGSAGVGKTTLALQFICAGADAGEPGLYLTFEETRGRLLQMACTLGLDLGKHVEQGLVEIVHEVPLGLDPDAFAHRVLQLMDELPARRLVVDSLSDLAAAIADPARLRETVYSLVENARRRGTTAILTIGVPELFGQTAALPEHISVIVDGIVLLKYLELESEIQRSVAVLKMRSTDHDKAIRRYIIGPGGFTVLERFEGAEGVMAGAPRSTPITLAVRSFTEFDERLNEQLLRRFAQINPNVQPIPMTLPYNPDEARLTIERSLAAPHTHLSVLPLCMYWMPQMIDPRKLTPVDDLCPDPEEHLSDLIECATVGGRLYAVPAIALCGVLLYRKDLLAKYGFETPPSTWEEVIEQAKTVLEGENDPDLEGYVFPGYLYEGISSTFLQNLWSNGGDVIDAKGHVMLEDDAAHEAACYMHDLVHVHRITPRDITGAQRGLEPQQEFWDGKVLFLTMLPTAALAMLEHGSPLHDRIGIAPPPRGPRGERSVSFLGGWHYAVPLNAKAPAAAAQFIQFMTNRQVQKERAIRGGALPTLKSLYDDPELLASHPHYHVLKEIVFTARSRHYIPRYLEVSSIMQRHLHSMLCGSLTPEAAVEAMARGVRALLA